MPNYLNPRHQKRFMPKAKKGKPAAGAPQPGDMVRLICEGQVYQGVFLPGAKNDDAFITLKMSSGYNIGVKRGRITSLELLEKGSSAIPGARAEKEGEEPRQKGQVALLGCGGTIVNRIDYRTGAVYPATSPRELLAGIPAAAKFNVRARTLFSIASEDMSIAHWQKMAEEAASEMKDGAEGVIITHGTDIMHYSSAALSFMLQNLSCPVIFTGSQRSSDRGSSDSETNVRSALIASRADLSGVFICMHENLSDDSCLLHFGTRVRKMHTSRRDAFRSISCLPAARVFPETEKLEKISGRCLPRNAGAKLSLDTKMNTNVAMQYIYPGIRPDALSPLSKYDGVVLVGFGLGHLPVNLAGAKDSHSLLPAVKELIASGIPVVFASQVIYGRVDMNVYTNQRALLEAGVIGHMCDMTPETAYVKLMWVLGREKKMEKVKLLMESDIVGEITQRSEITDY